MYDQVVSPTPWQCLPHELVPVLRAQLDAVVGVTTGAVAGALPGFTANPKLRLDVERGVRVALERFLELIGTGQPALPPHVRETFVELGAAEARENRTPETLLAALRTAARVLIRTLSDALSRVRPIDTNDLIDLSDAITTYVDELASASTDGFTLQLREQASESDRRHRALAELLLRGNASEREVRTAAESIGWRHVDALVPIILPPEHTRDARFHYRSEAVVIERERDSVLMLRQGASASRAQLAESLHGRGAVVGPTVAWTRLPEAVRLAELTARHITVRMNGASASAGPVFVEDLLATLALRGEQSAFAIMTERRLAPFTHIRETTRERLLDTLHSWLRHWGSRAAVAAEMHIHPQTVSYRMRQLRDLLGDDLDDASRRFELLLALADRASSAPVSRRAGAPDRKR